MRKYFKENIYYVNQYKNAIVVLLISALFFGCGKSSFVMLDKNKNYKEALEYTQKQQLKNYLDTVAVFRVTYLNKVYPKDYKDKEYFFVGIYLPDDIKKKEGLFNPLFKLALNDKTSFKATELKYGSSTLIKLMPLTNRWTKYYVVEFEKDDEEKLVLTYTYLPTAKNVEFLFSH